jgi:hypothetical protein
MMLSFDGQGVGGHANQSDVGFSVPIAGFCVWLTFSDFQLTTMSMCALFFIVRIPASHYCIKVTYA